MGVGGGGLDRHRNLLISDEQYLRRSSCDETNDDAEAAGELPGGVKPSSDDRAGFFLVLLAPSGGPWLAPSLCGRGGAGGSGGGEGRGSASNSAAPAPARTAGRPGPPNRR